MDRNNAHNLDFDWMAPGALGDGYLQKLLLIQAQDPMFWSDIQGAWIVTRHADILEGMRDVRLSNSRYHLGLEGFSGTEGHGSGATLRTVRRWIFNQDGREHMRLRTLLMKPFSRTRAESYRPAIKAIFERYLQLFSGCESFDFSRELAGPFVAEALLQVIGFADVLRPERVIEMANTIIAALVTAGDAKSVQAADRTIDELTPLIEAEIAKRRVTPRDDLLTNLVQLSEGGERLTTDDVISLFHVLMLAAIDTTAHTLTLIMPVMDESPERRAYLREHPDQITAIVEELQRYVGMLNMMHRIVREDFEWHGRALKAGQMVYFMLAAGNWDPRVFSNPSSLDFSRERNQSLAFAPGLHHCIGIHIAKLELEEALKATFARFDRAAILAQPRFQSNYMNRCYEELRVKFVS